MRAATRIALATLLVLASASEVTAQSRHRAAQRGRAPPAEFQQRYPTTLLRAVLARLIDFSSWHF